MKKNIRKAVFYLCLFGLAAMVATTDVVMGRSETKELNNALYLNRQPRENVEEETENIDNVAC